MKISKTQVFLYGIRAGSLIFFFPLLSWSRHYSHRIASFSSKHHCLPPYNFFFFGRKPQLIFVSSLHKPKTEVTGHSEVELVETITPMCSRSSEKSSHAAR